MKKKEMTSMHAMKSAELVKMISDAQGKLAEYLVNRYSKQSKNVHEGTALRRRIAVASTILSEKETNNE
jgi:ribosomal protein L29